MTYCPECKREFSEEEKVCPEHGIELVAELPFQTIEGDDTTWVEIASAGTEEEAVLLKGFLEAEGIVAQVESLKFTMEPVNFGKLGEIRIYVRAEDEPAAVQLLQNREVEYRTLQDEDEIVTDQGPVEISDDATAGETEET
ncbi:MAG TPA: hypothetical protein VMT00_11810 [Thermoanaerobaculia bacterium]|nr:hypothetical protein [Thermoanaerobaculia bacterium]